LFSGLPGLSNEYRRSTPEGDHSKLAAQCHRIFKRKQIRRPRGDPSDGKRWSDPNFGQRQGVGISHKIKDKIFDMFYRGNDLSQGSGLGLYVVRDTTEKLNAVIEVKSEPEEGSEFIVTFKV